VADTPAALSIPRLAALDGIRIVAACCVVLQHVGYATGVTTGKSWGGWIALMDFAVAVFFVLSGFVLFQPWAKSAMKGESRPATGRFLWRRFARILPAYWLAVVVCLTFLQPNAAPTMDWIRHFGLAQIYQFEAMRRGLGQTWTLCVEAALYVVLPFVATALVGRNRPGRAWDPRRAVVLAGLGALVTTTVWVTLLATGVLKLYLHIMWLPGYALWFAGGIVLSVAFVALRSGVAPTSWAVLDRIGAAPVACWATAAGLLAIASTSVIGPRGLTAPTAGQFATQLVVYLGVALMILIPLIFGPQHRLRSFVGSRPMSWLGTLGYSLFLWHPFVLEMVYRVTGWKIFSGRLLSVYAMTLAGGLLLAMISYFVVERPVIRMANNPPKLRRSRTVEIHSAAIPASATD
jgi:peptidoglycan/LPS O-acetylase OafA/YrhL